MAADANQESQTCVSRVIKACPNIIFAALVDPLAVVKWLPPRGMVGEIGAFDARAGGAYEMSLAYVESDHSTRGKTSYHTDVVRGRFVEIIPNQRLVQQVAFESDDPAFASEMTIIWSLTRVQAGTEVAVVCENVPRGVRPEDHEMGITSTLENLAAFTE